MNGTHDLTGDRERGFALIALMAVVGAASLGVLLAVAAFVPAPGEREARVGASLDAVQRLVAAQFLRDGAFPSSLDTLERGGGVFGDTWLRDPYGLGAELRFVTTSAGRQVSSRGPDQRTGTADDLVATIEAEPLLRVRQRLRLRMVRAVHVADLEATVQASASPPAPTTVQQAVRDHALARRRWRTATAAERLVLQETLDATATVVATQMAAAGYSAPVAVTGAGGFMARLGLGDERACDGVGRAYALHPVLGVSAVGYDAVRGTDDDM